MGFFDRIEQKPESERRRLFWLIFLGAAFVVVGVWALTFRATLRSLSLKSAGEAFLPDAPSDAESPPARELFGSQLDALKNLFPLLKRTLPGREETINR